MRTIEEYIESANKELTTRGYATVEEKDYPLYHRLTLGMTDERVIKAIVERAIAQGGLPPKKITTMRKDDFLVRVNEVLWKEHQQEAMSDDDAKALIAYRDEFEKHPMSPVEGTIEFYADWILERRKPIGISEILDEVNKRLKQMGLLEIPEIDHAYYIRRTLGMHDQAKIETMVKIAIERRELVPNDVPANLLDRVQFCKSVDEELTRMGLKIMDAAEVEEIFAERSAFKSDMWVWDGTESEHYAKLVRSFRENRQPCVIADDVPIGKAVLGYTKTFTSFGGADVNYIINGRFCGEISHILWVENMQRFIFARPGEEVPPNFNGTIEVTVFGDETNVEKAIHEVNGPLQIATVYANEYGQRMIEYFINPKLNTRTGGTRVDQVCMTEHYTFSASDMIRAAIPEGIPTTLDDGTINPEIFLLGRSGRMF